MIPWIQKSSRYLKAYTATLILALTLGLIGCGQPTSQSSSPDVDFNFDWEFALGELSQDDLGLLDQLAWRSVRLPHDWSVEHSFTEEKSAGATAFLPGGIGWYRKQFELPKSAAGKVFRIEFDCIYNNSTVWINGHRLGFHPYGYTPFSYDLSDFLRFGARNEIVVKADRSSYIDCRWYPGSGIYRNVRLVAADPVHIPQWGVFVSTPEVSDEQASVSVVTDVVNKTGARQSVTVRTTLLYDGQSVSSSSETIDLAGQSQVKVSQSLEVKFPQRWDIDSPELYTAHSEILSDGKLLDTANTPFGIRSFEFDKDKGFSLNGRNLLIKGVCLHHDGGLVGSAVPIGVWERRLRTLKAAGCNAIRTAHNPPSSEFLDLCDRMGFLVQDEAFDEWNNPKDKKHNYNQLESDPLTTGYTEYFTDWSERDLKSMVLRDRNHPSIVMWSIGNEIEWTYPGYQDAPGYWGETKKGDVDYYWDEPPYTLDEIKTLFAKADLGEYDLASTAKRLADWVREIDKTRPVTANLVIPSVSNFSGYADTLDIVGLSYRQSVYDYVRRNYPDMTFLGTENWARYHEWIPVLEKDFISGIFLWTGIDYMGESSKWPIRGSSSGLLDFAGFEKPSYQLFKTLWTDEPHIYLATQTVEKSPYRWDEPTQSLVEKEKNWAARQKWGWHELNEHWNYHEGELVAVEVYTNQSAVELFLDGKTLGIQKLNRNEDRILKWQVPFSSGKLEAKSVNDPSTRASLRTAGEFAAIEISADQTELKANGYDVSHIVVQLTDAAGIPVRTSDKEVVFKIEGDARLLGVDNGLRDNVQDYQNDRLVTGNGKALMILQANRNTTTVRVTATCGNVSSKTLTLNIKQPPSPTKSL